MDDHHGQTKLGLDPISCTLVLVLSMSLSPLHAAIPYWLEDCLVKCQCASRSIVQMLTSGLIQRPTSCVVSLFKKTCHVACSGWITSLQCPSLLPINSQLPLLPSHFLIFSILTSVVHRASSRSFPLVLSPLRLVSSILLLPSMGFFQYSLLMAAIVVSLSSDRDEMETDQHHNESNTSDSSSDSGSHCSSSRGNTTDEQYSSRVPGVPLEVLQEQMRTRVAFGSSASPPTSALVHLLK